MKNNESTPKISNKLTQQKTLKDRTGNLMRKYFLLVAMAIGGKAISQIDLTQNQNEVKIMQVDVLESLSYTASMTDTERADKQHRDAKFAQNGIQTHIAMKNNIVRMNPIQTNMTEGATDVEDVNTVSAYTQSNALDPRDAHVGYFNSNYRGRAAAPTTSGQRNSALGNVSASEDGWMSHESFQHGHKWTETTTFDHNALNSTHDQAIQNVEFIYTNAGGSPTTYTNGYTNGNPAGTSGFRLQNNTTSPANNVANPTNGGNGYNTRYGDDGSKIEIPYLNLDNTSYEPSNDVIAGYYNNPINDGLPGHDYRYENTTPLETPTTIISNGDNFSLGNLSDYTNLFIRNTTNTSDDTHVTLRVARLNLYEESNQGNDQQVWSGLVNETVDLSDEGLNPALTYVFKVSTSLANAISPASEDLNILGVENYEIDGLKIYPNPVEDILTINANEDINEIIIYNMLGQVVLNQKPNSRQNSIELGHLQTGIYLAKLKTDNGVTTKRIMKK